MSETRIVLLLAASADAATVGRQLEEVAAKIVGAWGPGVRAHVGQARGPRPDVAPDPGTYEFVVENGLSNGVKLGGFDVVLDLAIDGGAPQDANDVIAAAVADLGTAIDRERSAVVVGKVHVLMEGTGDTQLFYGMRRLPEVSVEEFGRYWREQHAEVGKVTPGLAGYRQLHADGPATRAAAAAAGLGISDFDGVALEWFATVDDFVSAVGSRPSHGVKAKASESNFNDIARAVPTVATVHEVVVDG